MNEDNISLSTRYCDLSLVILTGVLYFLNRENNHLKFIIGIFCMWAIYIYINIKKNKGILKLWGLRLDNLKKSFKKPTFFFILVFIPILIIYLKSHNKNISINKYFYITLGLYLFWGILQQFLLQSMITRNLNEIIKINEKKRKFIIISIMSILFGLLHHGDQKLFNSSIIIGGFWTYFYIIDKNIIPLGIYHAIIATIYYFWVKNENILQTLIKKN